MVSRFHDSTTTIRSMGMLCILALLYSTLSPTVVGGELTDEEKDAGFVLMFNGRDFNGWRFTGEESDKPPENWIVADGVIKLAWKGTGLQPEKGYIGLQAEGAPLEFRKPRIQQIK